MKCPFNKDRRGKECVHNIKGNCTGFCASLEKAEKIELMRKIAKEGHSFPHYDTCKTCEDDFDEVYNLGKKIKEDEVFKIIDKFSFRQDGWNYVNADKLKHALTSEIKFFCQSCKAEVKFGDEFCKCGRKQLWALFG